MIFKLFTLSLTIFCLALLNNSLLAGGANFPTQVNGMELETIIYNSHLIADAEVLFDSQLEASSESNEIKKTGKFVITKRLMNNAKNAPGSLPFSYTTFRNSIMSDPNMSGFGPNEGSRLTALIFAAEIGNKNKWAVLGHFPVQAIGLSELLSIIGFVKKTETVSEPSEMDLRLYEGDVKIVQYRAHITHENIPYCDANTTPLFAYILLRQAFLGESDDEIKLKMLNEALASSSEKLRSLSLDIAMTQINRLGGSDVNQRLFEIILEQVAEASTADRFFPLVKGLYSNAWNRISKNPKQVKKLSMLLASRGTLSLSPFETEQYKQIKDTVLHEASLNIINP